MWSRTIEWKQGSDDFESGTGNVLLAYESDALNAKAAGQAISIVTRHRTPSSRTRGADDSWPYEPRARAFYDYCSRGAGQAVWVSQNFRGTIPYVKTLRPASSTSHAFGDGVSSEGGQSHGEVLLADRHCHKIENAHGYTS